MCRSRVALPFGMAVWMGAVASIIPAAAQSVDHLARYLGPSDVVTTYPDMTAYVEAGYEWIGDAFGAVEAGDARRVQSSITEAANVFGQAVSSDPTSRDAAVGLGVALFYRAYYVDASEYAVAIEYLTRILEVDAYADQAARYLATAYAQRGDQDSAVYYANYVQSISTDGALLAEMDSLKQGYFDAFLKGWNAYGDYYETGDTKVTQFDPKTLQVRTLVEITPQYEQETGRNALQALTSDLPPANDAETSQYLQSLVNRLVMASPGGPPFANRVTVVDVDAVNALAMPGSIVVFTGLLRRVENEGELVAVLSHELAHIYAHHAGRHTVSNTRNQSIASSLIGLANIETDAYRQLVELGAKWGVELLSRGYSRGHEEEADRYGTHIAFNAGYNPTYMTSFFVKLFEDNPQSRARLLATHPPTPDRISNTTEYLKGFPLDQEMQFDSRDFQDMKRRLGSW